MIVLTGASLLLLLVRIAVLVSAGAKPGIVAGKSDEALIPSPAAPLASRLTAATATTAFPADGWVQAFSETWAPDESTDTEQYLDIAHVGSILQVQVTDDEDWAAGPPAVADYPIETIVVVWGGPSQYEDSEWNNIEYATFDVGGNLVLPITQLSDNGSSPDWDYVFAGHPVPAVGPTTGNVLFAWYQFRHLGPGVSYTELYYAVRGPDGAEIRGASEIASTWDYLEEVFSPAAAAFGNGFFLVAWSRSPFMGEGEKGIYYMVLNTRGGIFVGPTKLTGNLIWATSADVRATRLASGHVLLTWTGVDPGLEIYYAVLSSAGRVVQAPSRLSDAPYGVGGSDAAGLRNGNIIVAWEEHGAQAGESQIAYAVLNSAYTTTLPLPTATTYLTNPLEAENYAVCVARDGDYNAVLTWRGSAGQHIYAAVVGDDGQVRTWPEILRTARGTGLTIDSTGAGCGSLPASMFPSYYVPLVAKND